MGLKRFVRKITRPVAKVLDKVVPNEIKPVLPYVAAIAPVLGPMGAFGSTIGGLSKLQAAGVYGLGSLAAQLSQEGSEGDFDLLPVISAAGTGYLAAPGQTGMTTKQVLADQGITGSAARMEMANRPFLTKAKDLGITGVQGIEKMLQAPQTATGFKGTAKALTAAASPGVTVQATQDAVNFAKQAAKDYEAELAEYNRFVEDQNLARVANEEDRARAIYNSMVNAGAFTLDTIKDTLDQLDLPSGFFAYGGRVKLANGGKPYGSSSDYDDYLQDKKDGVIDIDTTFNEWLDDNAPDPDYDQSYKMGGKVGGIMDLGGREMDLRGGGFVPIGAKERADDVPARLSKNEFVMTADAVRGAGGGNINLGAKRMYDTMNKLEAKGRA